MKCRCGRNMHWTLVCNRMNERPWRREYYCPTCIKSSKECDCNPPRFEIQPDGTLKDRYYEKRQLKENDMPKYEVKLVVTENGKETKKKSFLITDKKDTAIAEFKCIVNSDKAIKDFASLFEEEPKKKTKK